MGLRQTIVMWHGGQLLIACVAALTVAFGSLGLASEINRGFNTERWRIYQATKSVQTTSDDPLAELEYLAAVESLAADKAALGYYEIANGLGFGIVIPLLSGIVALYMSWVWLGDRSPRRRQRPDRTSGTA